MLVKNLLILLLLLLTSLLSLSRGKRNGTRVVYSFEKDFQEWQVQEDSWDRAQISTLLEKRKDIPFLKGKSQNYVIIPSGTPSTLAVMRKDISVKKNSVLEIYFSAVVLGWKKNGSKKKKKNPSLDVLYNGALVFHLDDAIEENLEYFASDQWNQFRLYSSYDYDFNMTVTIIAKKGSSSNFIALDNIIIKETPIFLSNDMEEEPEADLQEKDGDWDKIFSQSELKETQISKNLSISERPEFCDLDFEKGPCLDNWKRFYYNQTTKKCESFLYGGCDGNENNFSLLSACESSCKHTLKATDDLLPKVGRKTSDSLIMDFEDGIQGLHNKGWETFHFSIVDFDSNSSNVKPSNPNSKYGASPTFGPNAIFRRPTLKHYLNVIYNRNLTINFSLIVVGEVAPNIHPFLEHMNPGFKIYIGDFMIFDFLSVGNYDKLRIESWKGSAIDNEEIVIMDDFSLLQTQLSEVPTSTTSPFAETTVNVSMESTESVTGLDIEFPCELPLNSGPCKEKKQRFFYDSKTDLCQSFIYGGCKGNANNFHSKVSCIERCSRGLKLFSTTIHPVRNETPEDICKLPLDSGVFPCATYSERFFYDYQIRTCIPFFYTGCGGNKNNFQNLEDCEKSCLKNLSRNEIAIKTFFKKANAVESFPRNQSDCLKPIEEGPCRRSYVAYAFDQFKNDCIRFSYSGCGGNNNRFYSISECRKLCRVKVEDGERSVRIRKTDLLCNHPPSSSKDPSCSKRYFYNKTANACMFRCGKSGGFFTRTACIEACSAVSPTTPPSLAIITPNENCLKPVNPGSTSCNESLSRYYFDRITEKCMEFVYTGCGADNGNIFVSKEACSVICMIPVEDGNPCFSPKDEGSIRCEKPTSQRYYFDFWKETCLEMKYSGCGGNRNNFPSFDACYKTCRDANLKPLLLGKSDNGSINTPTVAEIVLGVVLLSSFVVGGLLGVKYYKLHKENYGIFRNESARSSNAGNAVEYANPTYDNVFQLKNPTDTCSEA